MGQALYRKQRPRSFNEVVGQDHIITTLKNAIKSGRISHAYLFTGPRGVGKTSVARILAHEINNLPYVDESIHLDIIEIDAASNRRIDEIRDLRDRVNISPTSAKYKVYIIDEVHMLTREAFNALLKTLEEPPAHCVFILATTEAHKLPETIVSRTQRFEFKLVGADEVADHLKTIAKKEKLQIDQSAIDILAEYGEGSFRDSISLLDQLGSSGQPVTEATVRELLGLPPGTSVAGLVSALYAADSPRILELLGQLRDQGTSSSVLAKLLGKDLRLRLLGSGSEPWLTPLLIDLIEVPASARPDDALEITLLSACVGRESTNNKAGGNSELAPEETPPQAPAEPKSNPSPTKPEAKAKVVKPSQPTNTEFSLDTWEDVLAAVKDRAASLYTALRLATPSLQEHTLTLAFQFPLHQKKVNQAAHKALITQVIEDLYGQKLTIECSLSRDLQPAVEPAPPAPRMVETDDAPEAPPASPIQTISNIFGGAEVLES